MQVAVSNRPVTKFDTDVTLPEWQLEPDDEAYGQPDADGRQVDDDGNPIPDRAEPEPDADRAPPAAQTDPEADQRIDQKWIDGVLGLHQ